VISFFANLGVGSYSISTALAPGESHLEYNYEWKDLGLVFNVLNVAKNQFVGSTWIETAIDWKLYEK
jgi:lipopolysaccharide transport system ATP-binding protein